MFVLVSLLVCLIPTTIGGLLSAIGIAGMDRMVQHSNTVLLKWMKGKLRIAHTMLTTIPSMIAIPTNFQ